MNPIILILGILILNASAIAQYPVSGTVVDADTKEGIPYVNVGIAKIAKGTVSNDYGYFELNSNSSDDLLTFSAIGYKSQEIKASTLQQKSTIALESKNYELKTIEVEASRFNPNEFILGVRNEEKRGHSVGFGSAQLGAEIGTYIPVRKPTYIKSAHFVLNHAKGDSLLFRINMYRISDGEIKENILKDNILIKKPQQTGTISVDLSPYHLILDSDILLTLEWLRNFDEQGNKGVTFDTKKSKKGKGIYVRYSSNSSIRKLTYKKKLKPCFYLIGKETL